MANYTITRQTEPEDLYGCTTWQTSQVQDENAVIGGGLGNVDGDIIWYLDANAGFTVSVDDFNIPNTIPTLVAQIPGSYRTFIGGNIPPPVLGVVMEQITVTRIKITLYLHPTVVHDIAGPVFVMPANDVSAFVPIEGCAQLQGNPVQIQIQSNPILIPTGVIPPAPPVTTVNINPVQTSNVTHTPVNNDDLITGIIPRKFNSDEPVEDDEILTYTVTADDGDRFVSEPTLTPTTMDYNITSQVTKDEDNNIVSKTFTISKNI